ncbi:MAG: hypothetical protein M3Y33_00190 [Actinomycetota bacterium]|nr:hypothetical protein [Actinomycetota bacterium]
MTELAVDDQHHVSRQPLPGGLQKVAAPYRWQDQDGKVTVRFRNDPSAQCLVVS